MRTVLLTGFLAASVIAGCSASSPTAAVPSVSAPAASSVPATAAPVASVQPTAASTAAPTEAPSVAPTPAPDPLTITGTIRDSAGKPFAGAGVYGSAESGSGAADSNVTLVDGRYQIHLPRAGAYFLQVAVPFAPPLWLSSSGACKGTKTCAKVTVGGSPLVIDATLPKYSTVSGVVFDKRGRPFAGVQVDGGNGTGNNNIGTSETDASGHFTSLAVPGKTDLEFWVNGDNVKWFRISVGTKNITNLKVTLPVRK